LDSGQVTRPAYGAGNANVTLTATITSGNESVTVVFDLTVIAYVETTYTLTVSTGAGGTVSGTQSGQYAEGTIINLTAVANSGYSFSGWTVTGITLADPSSTSISFAMPDNNVNVTATWQRIHVGGGAGGGGGGRPPAQEQPPQEQIQDPQPPLGEGISDWAVEQVTAAIEEGLVPEALQSNFAQTTTRAEFAALAVYLYENQRGEITGRGSFVDTNDVNVQKAAYIGVVIGVGNNMFAPHAQLTREQAAVMLTRLADVLEQPLPIEAATFADNAEISYWAIESAGRVQAAEIMEGVGNNVFAPRSPYTREQSIVTILRLFEFLEQ
jgi:uncharacterized repeat protein (TIGR02543 family)